MKVSCISYVRILYNYEDYSVEDSTQNVTLMVIYDCIIYSRNTLMTIYRNYDILTEKKVYLGWPYTETMIYKMYSVQKAC